MTIAGQETVAELKDLVAAKDYTIAQLEAARAALGSFDTSDAWDSDFNALKTRYTAAKFLASMAFGRAALTPLPDSTIPAPLEWASVLKAIRQDPDVQTTGDLQDLSDRLSAAGGKPDYSKTPQPRKGTDVDLNVYKAADTTIRKGETAAKQGTKSAAPWIIGAILAGIGVFGFTRR